jgi:hypothetical protein
LLRLTRILEERCIGREMLVRGGEPRVSIGMDSKQWTAVTAVLRSAWFPANRQDLVNHARQQPADEGTLALITALLLGIYRNLVDVRDRLGVDLAP